MSSTQTVYAVAPALAPTQLFAFETRPARWTSGRLPVIYAAEHAAAALTEFRAHAESSPIESLKMGQAQLPDGPMHAFELAEDFPWRERPYRDEVQALGDAWLERGDTLTAHMPSVLCPHEYNVLINPRHPSFGLIRYAQSAGFRMDQGIAW